jgi:hypothetical protein
MEEHLVCPVCGIHKINGTFRFSYKPLVPVSADDVAGLVCSNAKKGDNATRAYQCINTGGDPDKGDSWEKRLNSIP